MLLGLAAVTAALALYGFVLTIRNAAQIRRMQRLIDLRRELRL